MQDLVQQVERQLVSAGTIADLLASDFLDADVSDPIISQKVCCYGTQDVEKWIQR